MPRHGFPTLCQASHSQIKGGGRVFRSLWSWSLGSPFVNQRGLVMEAEQAIQPRHETRAVSQPLWHPALSLECSFDRKAWLPDNPGFIGPPRWPAFPCHHFRATQEVFGEWSFQLFVNTSELGRLSVNSPHEQRAQCVGFGWYFYQVF